MTSTETILNKLAERRARQQALSLPGREALGRCVGHLEYDKHETVR